ncbi:hypothetical protein [Streptomyces sp. NBC_00198]|uniref:hypothetical protein n=1 Tax=Streptomyces sp. NBC_00198 TaxID=2975677 RepID=UPI002251C4B2|nr:hypothetical protein [Streptomyces sp. NBC_00198]MCX5285942.1 hypothetical protein [Streptomyces sp. NBC_00198]MCX5286251.1 hypothetical protein [Streptomyces sp. NBC_00198]
MPETTHPRPPLPTRRRSRGYLLPHPSLLQTTVPTALRAQHLYGAVRGGDSPEVVTDALLGKRTALRQLCDSLQLENRAESAAERDAREALAEFGLVYGSAAPAHGTRALEALGDALERLLGHLHDVEFAPRDSR